MVNSVCLFDLIFFSLSLSSFLVQIFVPFRFAYPFYNHGMALIRKLVEPYGTRVTGISLEQEPASHFIGDAGGSLVALTESSSVQSLANRAVAWTAPGNVCWSNGIFGTAAAHLKTIGLERSRA